MMEPLVRVEHLSKHFGDVRALDDVSFAVTSGEWIAIMGPSGSGKTTLINILGGLELPSGGSIVVDGTDLAALGEPALTRYRAEKVGFIFQQFHLVPYLTALENVMLAQYFHSMTDEAEAREALGRVGLADRITHLPAQLSGGEQQRVAIARALINHPRLILADEPTGNLDEQNEEIVLNLFRELHAAGHTILLVTHALSLGRLANRRIELTHGRLAQITSYSAEEEERFDHLLEQLWTYGEGGVQAGIGQLAGLGLNDHGHLLSRMTDLELIRVADARISFTERGEHRARDVVRRRRLAERLFTDTFAFEDPVADSQACKFEHIISPELDEKICTFLGHPETCPHGHTIPPGPCCLRRR
jgi:putative ABC transport system ATP-binding protein